MKKLTKVMSFITSLTLLSQTTIGALRPEHQITSNPENRNGTFLEILYFIVGLRIRIIHMPPQAQANWFYSFVGKLANYGWDVINSAIIFHRIREPFILELLGERFAPEVVESIVFSWDTAMNALERYINVPGTRVDLPVDDAELMSALITNVYFLCTYAEVLRSV